MGSHKRALLGLLGQPWGSGVSPATCLSSLLCCPEPICVPPLPPAGFRTGESVHHVQPQDRPGHHGSQPAPGAPRRRQGHRGAVSGAHSLCPHGRGGSRAAAGKPTGLGHPEQSPRHHRAGLGTAQLGDRAGGSGDCRGTRDFPPCSASSCWAFRDGDAPAAFVFVF